MAEVNGLASMMGRYLKEAGAWVVEKVGDVDETEDETEDDRDEHAGEGNVMPKGVNGHSNGSRTH